VRRRLGSRTIRSSTRVTTRSNRPRSPRYRSRVGRVERIQRTASTFDRVGQQVAVGLLDLQHRRPGHPRDLERRDPGRDALADEGVPEGVGFAVIEPRRGERRLPLVAAPVVQVQVAAARCGEQQRLADPGWQLGECLEALASRLLRLSSPAHPQPVGQTLGEGVDVRPLAWAYGERRKAWKAPLWIPPPTI
jgi:hypothetical protein